MTQATSSEGGETRRPVKILLSVFACSPHQGSEPGVGWNVVKQVSKYPEHEIWAMTRSENREAIEREVAINPIPNVHWVFYDVPRWARAPGKGGIKLQFYYYLWQLGAYFEGRKIHKQVNLDIVQHVTYVKYWVPSFLSNLPVPFIWGPVGGGETAPNSFYATLDEKGRRYEKIRDTVRATTETLDPFVRRTARKARLALSTTEETAARIRKLGGRNVRILSESSLAVQDIDNLAQMPAPDADGTFRMISLGRLLGWKGFHFGIMAFAKLVETYPDAEYIIVGDGSQMDFLKQKAAELQVADRVKFTGLVPREQALDKLASAHVLVHPSLHDSGGWVCLEAMASGRPVVCLNLGGPAVQVTEKTGFVVEVTTPDQTVAAMAEKLNYLAENRQACIEMGLAGRAHVRENFNWDKRGERLRDLYQETVRSR